MLYMGLACPASGSSPHDERVRASASASAPHKAGMSIDHIVRARLAQHLTEARDQIHAVESALDDLNTPAAQDALEDSLQAWHRLQRIYLDALDALDADPLAAAATDEWALFADAMADAGMECADTPDGCAVTSPETGNTVIFDVAGGHVRAHHEGCRVPGLGALRTLLAWPPDHNLIVAMRVLAPSR